MDAPLVTVAAAIAAATFLALGGAFALGGYLGLVAAVRLLRRVERAERRYNRLAAHNPRGAPAAPDTSSGGGRGTARKADPGPLGFADHAPSPR